MTKQLPDARWMRWYYLVMDSSAPSRTFLAARLSSRNGRLFAVRTAVRAGRPSTSNEAVLRGVVGALIGIGAGVVDRTGAIPGANRGLNASFHPLTSIAVWTIAVWWLPPLLGIRRQACRCRQLLSEKK